eukprot:Hpha_TRINITY_DN16337_c1_g1::TRINITY_DN16337_c1_g1_i1::g.60820::m.60820/K03654/recQ; ATP-dependent DNA helicase RecQ
MDSSGVDPVPRLTALLKEYYGFDEFREGQLELLTALVGGNGQPARDAVGIMATGHGKSLCFQLAALYTGRPVVCISPLISLMTDQVIKINESIGRLWAKKTGGSSEIAAFLGPSQANSAEIEARAAKGEYMFVYVSPEKVTRGGLQLIETLHSRKPLACVAIDEAHCVSEWGNDFRPDYQRLGCIRQSSLRDVPMITLTATATPKVIEGIITSLGVRPGHGLFVGDFYRKNLTFEVRPKMGGVGGDLKFLFDDIKVHLSAGRPYTDATIIYATSQREVDTLQYTLQENINTMSRVSGIAPGGKPLMKVLKYHAGMDMFQRKAAHIAFLTGIDTHDGVRAPIIVATVAFGMGIDKPDVRQIIHWGPPRTVEAYYQQAGRAGRDGLASRCVLLHTPSDFTNYLSDFWAPKREDGSINELQRQVLDSSLNALKAYCLSTSMGMQNLKCRQTQLVDYLTASAGKSPAFPDWCSCDCCEISRGKSDGVVDLSEHFRAVLTCVVTYPGRSSSIVSSLLMGLEKSKLEKKVDLTLKSRDDKLIYGSFRATKYGNSEVAKAILSSSTQSGLVVAKVSSFTPAGTTRSITYEVLYVTPLGEKVMEALWGNTAACVDPRQYVCILPPPQYKQEIEKERERKAKLEAALAAAGNRINKREIPAEELRQGGGPTVQTQLKWVGFEDTFRKVIESEDAPEASKDVARKKQAALAELLKVLEDWRVSEAVRLSIASATIMTDTLLKKIAYACSHDSKVSVELLHEVGVRVGNVDSIAANLSRWQTDVWNMTTGGEATKRGSDAHTVKRYCLPPSWKYAGCGIVGGAGKLSATVEESLTLFVQGHSTELIGLKRAKQIAETTVQSHLLTGLMNGYNKLVTSRDAMLRLCSLFPCPADIAAIEDVVAAHPELAGAELTLKTPLKPLIEAMGVDNSFYNKFRWYICLKAMNFPFDDPAAIAEVADKVGDLDAKRRRTDTIGSAPSAP